MNDTLRTVFLTRHGELRVAWRILLFLVLLSLFAALFVVPVVLSGIRDQTSLYSESRWHSWRPPMS